MVTSKPSITNCPFTFRFAVWSAYTFSSDSMLVYFLQHVNLIQVAIARGFHLFPFRTEKLSLVTPMVLRNSGRVGSCRFLERPPIQQWVGGFLFCMLFFFLQTCVCLFSMCSRKYGSECTSLVQLSFRYFISSFCCRDAGIHCLRTHCEVLYWSYTQFFF